MSFFATVRTLWRAFSRYRWHLGALIVLGFLGAILEGIGINAAIPLVSFFNGGTGAPTDFITSTIKSLFDFFSIPFTFRYLLAFILSLFLLRAVAVVIFGYVRGWVVTDYLCEESEDMLRRTMLASWPFLLKQKIGALHNTLARDIQRSASLLEVQGQIIQSFGGFLMYLLVAVNISPTMTVYTLGGAAVLLLVVRPFLLRTQRMGQEMAQTEKSLAQFLTEHITGMKSIKAAGVERPALRAGNAFLRSMRKLSLKMTLVRAVSASLFQPFSLLFVIALFAATYKTPGFSIISFAAALYLIQKIFTYLESGQSALQSLSELLPYADNVSQWKEKLGAHREEVTRGGNAFSFEKSIVLKDVSLAYTQERPVLSGATITIEKGSVTGLIGPSGAGKTSVADLLLRLFAPNSGEVLVDGVSVDDIGLDAWRHSIGYVSQDVFLFNGTIEENIRLYRNLSKEAIVTAAKQAHVYDFISSLPDGFETVVGDRGVMLSGGQRQRIVLARALVGNPALLVLDEATSALDHESERLIQEAIHALRGTTTVFVIAHRPSTIATADAIVVLDRGVVVEQGTPAELLKNKDSYFTHMQARV